LRWNSHVNTSSGRFELPQEPNLLAPGAQANVVVGVSGGVSAYKVCGLVRLFKEAGFPVRVIPTESALKFVGAPTWAALSGDAVSESVWDDIADMPHVRLGQEAGLLVVAPATANILAKAAAGLADDLLTNTILTARCPVIFAPAMHTEMWEHPATQANVATLRERENLVLEPDSGRLTGADTGPGRLPDVGAIFTVALARLSSERWDDMAGLSVLISAGGTKEPLDPVRFLGNLSSGKMGYALAAAALVRGANVQMVSANVGLPPIPGVETTTVTTAAELHGAMLAQSERADVVVMAAAVADFRPENISDTKIKKIDTKAGLSLDLIQNPDVLAEIVAGRNPQQRIVGFAAETGSSEKTVLELGQRKLTKKKCDFLVINDVSAGQAFGTSDNEVTVLSADGGVTELGRAAKTLLANRIWNVVIPAHPQA
jgi:phosphopantothenoylcysteine decarboxylase/phosphopantothenate--cysteine ligase